MTSITAERSGLDRVGAPRLRRREQWGARRSYTDGNPVIEPGDHQFVHITITNPSNYASDDAHARGVEAIGIARFPNTGISYNRGFMRSGVAYEFQPIGRRGAHTVNNKNISTCSMSGCPSRGTTIKDPRNNLNYNVRAYVICQNVGDSVTDAQLKSMAQAMAADILAGFVRRGAQIHGHRCVSAKGCPGDRMWARMGELKRLRDHYVTNGFRNEDWFDMATEADLRKVIREDRAAAAKEFAEAVLMREIAVGGATARHVGRDTLPLYYLIRYGAAAWAEGRDLRATVDELPEKVATATLGREYKSFDASRDKVHVSAVLYSIHAMLSALIDTLPEDQAERIADAMTAIEELTFPNRADSDG